MANTKTKAAAAKAEKEQAERIVEWAGLALTLPPQIPDAVLLDLAYVQSSENASASFQMLNTMIGEAQYLEVRNKLKAGDVELKDVIELIGLVFAEYGTSEGESEASQDS